MSIKKSPNTFKHRAMRRMPLPLQLRRQMVWLPLLFSSLMVVLYKPTLYAWIDIFQWWLQRIDLDATVSTGTLDFLQYSIPYAYLQIHSQSSTESLWWYYLALSIGLLAWSFFLSANSIPLRYLLRIAGIILFVTVFFSFISPNSYPSDISAYTKTLYLSCVVLMSLVPWVHAFVYYIFGFSLTKKVFLTCVTLLFFFAANPMLILLHAYLILHLSTLLLPLLYFLFGLNFLIAAAIALYGWGVSWPLCTKRPFWRS